MQKDSYKYWAFISYSHRDQAWAEWLHHALETYRVPRRLVGRESAAGPLPRRLFPVFRDQDELPSSPNLSVAIDQALEQSRYLIVIASAYAAVSKWVDQEIARFRALGRGDRILCLIVDGEPHADLQPGKGLLECFPPELRKDGFEPIGADLRPGRDGKPLARLKLIAGLLGVGLDELRRRERRRRLLRRAGLAATALLSAAALLALWQMQQREKREALAQQALRNHIVAVYEKGRQDLLAHNQARAAVYLNEAYRLGVDTPALRFMLARAMRIVEAERLSFQTGAPVASLKFSPDAAELYTRGEDGTVRVWDTSSGRMLFQVPTPPRVARVARFSRTGHYLSLIMVPDVGAVADQRIFDARSGAEVLRLDSAAVRISTLNMIDHDGHRILHLAPDRSAEVVELKSGRRLGRLPGPFSLAGFSRDGRRIMTGTDSGEVAVWSGDTRRKLRSFHGLHTAVNRIDDTEDGSLVAASAHDGSIRGWAFSDGTLKVLGGHPSPDPWLIFNLDGTRLFTGSDDGVRVWNSANGSLVYALQFAGSSGNRADLSSDGKWLLGSSSSRLAMQDVTSGTELFTLDGHRDVPNARDISDDDRYVATGGSDGRVVIWTMPRIPDAEYLHHVDALRWNKRWAPGVAAIYSHDDRLIATAAADGLLKLWDASSHQLIRSFEGDPQSVNVASFSEDDRLVAGGGEGGTLKIWEVASGRLLRSFDCDGREVLTVSFGGTRYVAGTCFGGMTHVWDIDSGKLLASFPGKGGLYSRFSPDGHSLLVEGEGSVRLWDARQGRTAWEAPLPPARPGGMAPFMSTADFSTDGVRVLVGCSDGGAFLFDAHSGKLLKGLHEAAASNLNSVRLDPSVTQAVLADAGGAAILWRFQDGHVWLLRGHAGSVVSADFSHDSHFVLTGGVDATARLWDASSGEMLDVVGEHPAPMPEPPFQAAAFRRDGSAILTGSTDGTVREWTLHREQRSPAEIQAVLRCRVPWRVEGDALAAASPDDASCPPPQAP